MKRVYVLAFLLLLATAGVAQQSPDSNNPQDRTANPTDQTYTRPVQTEHGRGNWGLLGLLGLAGLLGRKRATTATYLRDERTYGEQQRRVG